MVVEYSEVNMGKVAPAIPLIPLFNEPSTSTITQLLPVAPGVVAKVKPVKLDALCIAVVVRPVAPVNVPPPIPVVPRVVLLVAFQ